MVLWSVPLLFWVGQLCLQQPSDGVVGQACLGLGAAFVLGGGEFYWI